MSSFNNCRPTTHAESSFQDQRLPFNHTPSMRSLLLMHLKANSRALPRVPSTSFAKRSFLSVLSPRRPTNTNGFLIHQPVQFRSLRLFQTESQYHDVADETLEDIQDAVEGALEDKGIPEFEVNYASGVLTMTMPPHGTWVLNKQTPNQQIWWSSPVSGPRRYQYEDGEWVFTRDDSHSMTLAEALKEELEEIYQVDLDL
jgi:frataxin